MRNLLALLAILLFSHSVLANPTVFGMTIHSTTVDELKKLYRVEHSGMNKYSNGDMYTIAPTQIDFDGLQEVTTIFSKSGVLLAVLTNFPKDKFDYLNASIADRYKRIAQNIPFVGNKTATYINGETEIELNAPHLSFTMSLNYIHKDLLNAFQQQSEAEKKAKEQREGSML